MKIKSPILALLFFSFVSFNLNADEIKQVDGPVTLVQISNPGCLGIRIHYEGKLSQERALHAMVDLNGARGLFAMERRDKEYFLSLISCPISCKEQAVQQKACTDRADEMRKIFYWAFSNGKAAPWFVEVAFVGEDGRNDSDTSYDNYRFYFP